MVWELHFQRFLFTEIYFLYGNMWPKKITKTFGHDTDLTLCPRYFIQVGSCKGVGGSQVSKGMNHF